ncbi:hypothetical protein HZA38_03150 [Candidatus Peregrinibacteria bacterium]|nr:hypothetical protein [Candidatus Peregrinibacteria bacterium]
MLKALFSSTTRIKLLRIFLLNPQKEYFIRELTRLLDEQINSVRRELNNLKKIGFLKCKNKDRKKYYYIDTSFLIFPELTLIFQKDNASGQEVVKQVLKMGKVELLLLSGIFVGVQGSPVDLFVVGDIDKEKLTEYTAEEFSHEHPVRFTVLSRDDFLYRIECHDKFVHNLINDERSVIAVNKIEKLIEQKESQ